MNYEAIKTNLISDYPKNEVGIYIDYLKGLKAEKGKDNTLKNWLMGKVNEAQFVSIFKKVKMGGVYIDGETVNLVYRNGLMPSYNYQAYKNRVLHIYPDTKFDLQNVHEGDAFSFSKESGRVVYSHKINNPFDPSPTIIGCYCVIKNERGEFLEILNDTDLKKMRSKAKTDLVLQEWYNQMTLKSVIKRACKRHFNDITGAMDKLDNENYDLDMDSVKMPDSVYDIIMDYEDVDKLIAWAASKENAVYHTDQAFRKAVDERKTEILREKNAKK